MKRRRALVHVSVDGPLPAIQVLGTELRYQATSYALARAVSVSVVYEVLGPFLVANDKGVHRISDNVFSIARELRSRGASVKVAPASFSPALLKQAKRRAGAGKESDAIASLAQTMVAWHSGRIGNEQALTSSDQALEAWLKVGCGVEPADRIRFPALLDAAVERGFITRRAASRLRTHHARRNAVQHRGTRVTRVQVKRAIDAIVSSMNGAPPNNRLQPTAAGAKMSRRG